MLDNWSDNSTLHEKEAIDKSKLPLIYRIILKIPGADFLENCSSGIFWAIVVPIFLALEFFLNMLLLLSFPFPLNITLVSIIPTIIFLIFLRISLERFIRWWNSEVAKAGFEWNIDKTIREYVSILKEKEEYNKS